MTMRRIVAALCVAAWFAPVATPDDMIGVTWPGVVYRIDSVTGAGFALGSLTGVTPAGSGFNSLARKSNGDLLCSYRVGTNNALHDLIRIDPLTGSGTPLNVNHNVDVRGLAFDANDVLYAIGTTSLLTIDVTTGMTHVIGAPSAGPIQGLSFADDGVLYGWSLSLGLIRIDPLTGAAVDVNPSASGTAADIQFLCAGPNGTLLAGRNQIFSIDVNTGIPTLIGGNGAYSDLRGGELIAPPCSLEYGQGCPGSGGFTPRLSLLGCATSGATTAIFVQQGLGGATALLAFGSMQGSVPMGAGCSLLVTPLLPFLPAFPLGGSGPGNGTLVLPGPVPVGVAGLGITTQVFVADPGGALGFANTNGLRITFQ